MYPTTFHPNEVCVSPVTGEHETMSSLRVLPLQYQEGQRCMVSAWMPTPEDLERLNSGLPIYLGVMAAGQPPVMLTTEPNELGFTL